MSNDNQPPFKAVGEQLNTAIGNASVLSIAPGGGHPGDEQRVLDLPERLFNWLLDLRLLRGVPLAYLVPDPQLLPTESIRFFLIDPTWMDRLVDGALAAGNIGTLDMVFTRVTVHKLRDKLDEALGLRDPKDAPGKASGMSGMLIRSELVKHWPDLIVRAFQGGNAVSILRQDLLAKNLMLVLFSGVPDSVEIREPHVSLRFGVEPGNSLPMTAPVVPVMQKLAAGKTGPLILDIAGLAARFKEGSRGIALNLQRPPYVQCFKKGVPEKQGFRGRRSTLINFSIDPNAATRGQ
jgi:hypothetical protein